MDYTIREKAIAAAGQALAHIVSARKSLIGERFLLAGLQHDVAKAAVNLQAAQREISEALRLIEAVCPTASHD